MRWALVGASDIAATRMIPALRRHGDDIVAVVSGDLLHGERFAEGNQIARATTDLESVLADNEVDAVYISSRNHQHAQHAIAALTADKHVLVEKPLALTPHDVAALLDAATAHAGVLAVNHHLPGAATHRRIRELIRAGAIGTPLAVSVCHAVFLPERLRGWRLGDAPGAGVALDITCHDASVINAALGSPPRLATAVGSAQGEWSAGTSDAVMSSMLYGQVTVQTHDAFTIAYRPTRFDVFGTEGALLASDVMTQDPIGEVILRTGAGERVVDVGERKDLYLTVLEAFRAAIAGDGEPTADGIAGANAFLVADAVQRAVQTEQTVHFDQWFSSNERTCAGRRTDHR